MWEENYAALSAFLALQTQLRTTGMGQLSGLDYTAVFAYLNFIEAEDKESLFEEIQLIEAGVLDGVRNRRAE